VHASLGIPTVMHWWPPRCASPAGPRVRPLWHYCNVRGMARGPREQNLIYTARAGAVTTLFVSY
jgi:hypothetical protein